MSRIHVVGAALFREGRCLVAQRGPNMTAPGRWEFPGGKVEADEDPRAALARELREELGVDAEIERLLARGEARVGTARIVLDVYAARLLRGDPQPVEHSELRWLGPGELPRLDWADPDVPIVPAVVSALRGS